MLEQKAGRRRFLLVLIRKRTLAAQRNASAVTRGCACVSHAVSHEQRRWHLHRFEAHTRSPLASSVASWPFGKVEATFCRCFVQCVCVCVCVDTVKCFLAPKSDCAHFVTKCAGRVSLIKYCVTVARKHTSGRQL